MCQLNAARTACATDVQTFAVGGTGVRALTVSTTGQSYSAHWGATRNLALSASGTSNARYRLEVAVGSVTLGFADLWVGKNSKDLRALPAGYVGLVRGSPLQIAFRIETRAVGTVAVSPGTASVPVGGTQAFTAAVTDHLGTPAGALTFFGGGSLGGAVTDHAVGTAATFGSGGSLTVGADGGVSFTSGAGFSGDVTFQYRLASSAGSSDATVTITVPAPPEPPQSARSATLLQEYVCRIAIVAQTVTCSWPGTGASDHVAFSVGDVSAGGGVVRFSATIQNLIPEAIGTPDGVVLDTAGIAAVIAAGPAATGGTGTAAFSNADGTRDYGAGAKPYFAWHEQLATDAVSAGKTWELRYGAGVTAIEFRVAVPAEVQPLLVINEVMINPADPSGSTVDSDREWFEVYNRGRLPVQMQGMLVSDSAASGPRPPHRIVNALVVPPGGYAVLGGSTNGTLNGGVPVDYAYGSALSLGNSLDALKISRVYGTQSLTID